MNIGWKILFCRKTNRIIIILAGLTLLLFSFYERGICAVLQAAPGPTDIRQENKTIINVSLDKLVQEAVKRNASAIIDYLQTQMSKEQIKAEKGIFEPIVQLSFTRQRIHVPNSAEDILTRLQNEYLEKTDALEFGVSGIVLSGAQWDLKFLDNRRNSSTIEMLRDYKYENDNALKLSLEQPLLRGFGKEMTRAKINLARVQSEVDEAKFEQKLMELVGVTIQLYWKLYGAQNIYQSWGKSLAIAEESLKDIELRARGGKIAQTEFMEAQSVVNIQRGELYNAKSKMVEAQTQLMTLLNLSMSDNNDIQLLAADNPFGNYDELMSPADYLKIALEKWPEYKIAKKAVEKARLQLKYANNQLLPQLNIIGTISSNSLDRDDEKAMKAVMDNRFISWSLGIKFSMPLIGNVQARSNYHIAEMRLRQADIEADSIVKNLSNSLYNKIEALRNFQGQLKEYERGLTIKGHLYDIEQMKLKAGKISHKNLLAQQEEYINYQRKVFSSVVNYRTAEAALDIALSNILTKYKLDKKDIYYTDKDLPGHLKTIFK